jgi:hypothetical protein
MPRSLKALAKPAPAACVEPIRRISLCDCEAQERVEDPPSKLHIITQQQQRRYIRHGLLLGMKLPIESLDISRLSLFGGQVKRRDENKHQASDK